MYKKAKSFYFENKKLWFDTLILISLITLTFILFLKYEVSNTVSNFIRDNNLDVFVATLAISSILMLIFMIKRFIELQKIIKFANTDPLIGIINRRKGLEYITNEINGLKNSDHSSSLIMYDIDDFKKINDIYGHDVGDYILKELSTIIEDHTRFEDMIIRWGGEEFMVICPNTNLENAIKLTQRFKKCVEDNIFEKKIRITASFGVIELNKNEEFSKQIIKVDKLLYKSKKEGKNRISF
ncbi:MAG: GGDEF domain-containing protein [Halarcobacter sp.]